jgi:hypothetical protein
MLFEPLAHEAGHVVQQKAKAGRTVFHGREPFISKLVIC